MTTATVSFNDDDYALFKELKEKYGGTSEAIRTIVEGYRNSEIINNKLKFKDKVIKIQSDLIEALEKQDTETINWLHNYLHEQLLTIDSEIINNNNKSEVNP